GLLTQLPGVLVPPPAYSAILLQTDRRAFFDSAIWNPAHSQIIGHWQLLLAGHPWDIALLRVFPFNPFGVVLLALGLAFALLIAIAILWQITFRSASSDLSGLTENFEVQRFLLRPDRSEPSARHSLAAFVPALGLVLIAPTASLAVFQTDPAHLGHSSACRATVDFLNANAAEDDLIAVRGYLDPFWYCYFNFGRPRGVWVGLPTFDSPANDTQPGDPFYLPGIDAQVADQTLFTEAATRYHRLWLVVDPAMPGGTEGFDVEVEAWLRERFVIGGKWQFGESAPVQVYVFAFQPK
ncbi:MAG TPA: hypothetical protein VJ020_00130, partial [Anaerolineales bacterium]|nr:hypothetical protein [Anaerolineales bacterium]